MNEIEHSHPAWAERVNFVLLLKFSYHGDDIVEQIWARKVDDEWYELCCIPFYAYGLALGDLMRFDTQLQFTGEVKPMGRKTVRTMQEHWEQYGSDLHKWFDKHELLVEARRPSYHSVDIPNQQRLEELWGELQSFEDSGILEFEFSNGTNMPFGYQGDEV